jgi:myo-inositol-1(or 4)-monophosphatase
LSANAVSDRLDFASQLARDAGKLAHSAFGTSSASLKGRHDIVTAMDSEVERFIRARILARYPDERMVGEEEGATGGGGGSDRVWVVDPIDGTANYARGIPRYCVSIGWLERGAPSLGVIYAPAEDALYAAETGGGAWLNGKRMAVSACADLEATTIECGWSTRRPNAEYVELVRRVFDAGCVMRRAGSGALGIADVAAGRIEGYCELHINAWDVAAGLVLVHEAGGRTNTFFTGDALANGNPVLVANPMLYDSLTRITGVG